MLPHTRPRPLKMRRLIDRWSLGAFLLVGLIEFLQCLKKLGLRARINGWRKVTGIFMREEHSKFTLASFRLNYLLTNRLPDNQESAKAILIERLAEFIRRNPEFGWRMEWGFFLTRRKKSSLADMVEAEFGGEGDLLRIVPYFDRQYGTSPLVGGDILAGVHAELIRAYNETKSVQGRHRAQDIYRRLRRWAHRYRGLSMKEHAELRHIITRLMNASFIQFGTLSGDGERIAQERMSTQDMRLCSHPGFGLLNIVCRFTADWAEADLWCQYHHVLVDGVPMQEMLGKLKKEWGEVGPVRYPALSGPAKRTELVLCTKDIYRVQLFVDFERFLTLRRCLNDRYGDQMGGPATVASMLMWSLAQHSYFKDKKFIFPVDTALEGDRREERSISFICMLPSKFFDKRDPFAGFFRYQREFNQRVHATRLGKSESYALFETYAIMHPVFYHMLRRFMPNILGEFVGTAGLTILKDAEMFVGPISDLHFDGFVSLGKMTMPTEDGLTAGAVSICGTREQIDQYVEAFSDLAGRIQPLAL
jgi:hypothetical protein